MPAKNRIKKYIPGGFYHIYNRGADRREIFKDDQDFRTLLFFLKRYLAPFSDEIRPGFKSDRPYIKTHKQGMNLNTQVELLAYCLMPNHFHLLVRQQQERGIVKLMRRVCTNYAMYFNHKYDRRGTLFEGPYKAVVVESGEQAVHLSRYIHLNPVTKSVKRFGPVETVTGSRPEEYEYSSYGRYLEGRGHEWLKTEVILGMFGRNAHGAASYRAFVEDYRINSLETLGRLTLDGEIS